MLTALIQVIIRRQRQFLGKNVNVYSLAEALELAEEKFTSGSAAVQLHQLTPLWAPLAAPQCSFPAARGARRLSPPLERAKAPRSGSCQGMETYISG